MHRIVTYNFSRLYQWSILLLMVVPALLYGQSDIPQFNLIRTPLSPAFTLLDASPAAVERPNTPSALAVSVLSNSSELPRLPANYSLEISPCWLFNQSTLTWQEDTSRTIDKSLWRTLSISLGTVRTGDSLSKATALAFGIRTSIFSGALSDKSQGYLSQASNRLKNQAHTFYTDTEIERKQVDVLYPLELKEADTEALAQKEIAKERRDSALELINDRNGKDSVQKEYELQVKKIDTARNIRQEMATKHYNSTRTKINEKAKERFEQTELQEFAVERHGFFLDFAVAGAWQFANDKADSGKFMRFGTWLTPAYKWQNWSIVGVTRVLIDNTKDTTAHGTKYTTCEAGASVIYTVERYGVSLEAVQRNFTWEQAPDNVFRLAMVFDAEVEKGMWITATLGRTYTATTGGSLLAQLGLSFNINSQRYHN